MKKLSFLFLSFYLTLTNLSGQDIVFTFNAKDASNTIDSIKASKVETGETAFVEGSNTINMSSFTTGTKLSPTNSEEISVYPNPFENVTQLKFYSNQNDNVRVSLINAAGQVVAEKKQNVTPGIHQFNISTKNNGLYVLNVAGNKNRFSQKIISTKNNQSLNKIEYNGYSSMPPKEKSAKTEGGGLIYFLVYSGDNITKIADSPTESKTYEVEFYECKDSDGKSYPIVQIGDQWWTAENLAYLPKVTPSSHEAWNFPDYSVYGYDGTSIQEAINIPEFDTLGVYYNWFAAIQSCPKGWHLPTDVEWNQLARFISTDNGGYIETEQGWTNVGNHLKTASGWKNEGNGIDNYGFSAIPAGMSTYYDGIVAKNQYTLFWTADGNSRLDQGNVCYMTYNTNDLFILKGGESHIGASVRYIKGISKPLAHTDFTTAVGDATAILNASVLSNNGNEITQIGFYFAEAGTELVKDENKIIVDGTTLDYKYNLDNLTSGKNYQFCAFATNSEGSSLGDTLTFRTTTDNIEYGKLIDSRDNHEYKTIQIGNQTWMAENLAFDAGDGCWAYDNDESNVNKYGRLYNWETAKNACPEGWHLPTNEEWQQLELHIANSKNISGKNFHVWSEENEIGKFLKAKTGWMEQGNGTDDFGFQALPGGQLYQSETFDAIDYYANWWTSKKVDENNALSWWVWYYSSQLVPNDKRNMSNGYSVRCVKD